MSQWRGYVMDNLEWMEERLTPTSTARFELILTDAPYNSGTRQERKRIDGTKSFGYEDSFNDFKLFLYPRLCAFHKILTENGSLLLMLDYREVHYAKVWLDEIFGRDCFKNEIIWAYDYGARCRDRWPCKHDTILWYVKNKNEYTFNYDAIDRIPYMAPGLQSEERAELGKTPTDVWWNTIVPTNGREKTGYATQKPLKLFERLVRVHSNETDWVLDPFAGSGTTAEASLKLNRNCILIDTNEDASKVWNERLRMVQPELPSSVI